MLDSVIKVNKKIIHKYFWRNVKTNLRKKMGNFIHDDLDTSSSDSESKNESGKSSKKSESE